MVAMSSIVSLPSTARRSSICRSSSVEKSALIGQRLCVPRLLQEDVQRGKVGVPFDQSGQGPEATDCRGVEFPDRLRYPGAVVVDQHVRILGGVMAGQMNLADRSRRQRVEVSARVEREVSRADIDVVDVAEDAAAGSAGCFAQKFRLGDRRMAKAQVGGRVLDQQASPECFLRLPDVPGKKIE